MLQSPDPHQMYLEEMQSVSKEWGVILHYYFVSDPTYVV